METDRLQLVSSEAQTIKYADIMDNTPSIVKNDPSFAKIYLQEVKHKVFKMNKGNRKLRNAVLDLLNNQ